MTRRARSVVATLLPVCWVIGGGWAHGADGARTPGAAERVAPTELEELMDLFASSGGVRARFKESRHLAILMAPIETHGVLYFAPPDRLARHTTWPGRARVVVDGERVAFGDETGHQVLELGASEVARALVSNLAVVLRGDLEALRARYAIAFRSDAGTWTLDLEPRSRSLRGIIERVRFSGSTEHLTEVETRESNGDRTLLTFSDVVTGLAWTDDELAQIFALGSSQDTP